MSNKFAFLRPRFATIVLTALGFFTETAQAERLSADVQFIEVQSQVKPKPKVFRQPRSIRMTLRDEGILREWSARRGDRGDQHSLSYESTIETQTKVQYVFVTWHFESRTSLVRITEFPSHTETIRLTFQAGKCSASVIYALKPGHQEFGMWDLGSKKPASHDSIHAEETWCEIQEDTVS